MLRLNVYCSLIPVATQVRLGSGNGSIIIHNQRTPKLSRRISIHALKDEMNGETSGFPGRSWDPGLEIEVPFEQRPVNEYSSLKDGMLYSWGELGPGPFLLRLGGLWLVAFTVLGVPIAAASFNPSKEPLKFVLAAGTGTLFLVSLIVLRIYLVTSFPLPPVIVTAVMLFIFSTPVDDFLETTILTRDNASSATATKVSNKFNIRKEELLKLPVEVKSDDDLAAAAAEAADGRPVYCRDRFYRALAGGQYCKWEDLIK